MDFEKKVRFLRFNIWKKNNDQVISLLEELGIDIQIDGYDTALNQAIVYENWEIAKYCIEKGADVNIRNSEDGTALILACKYGNLEIVKMLISASAEVNVQNKYDATPLKKAVAHNRDNLKLIEFLLQEGANPFMKEDYRRDDPRISTYNTYEFVKDDLKATEILALFDKYSKKE